MNAADRRKVQVENNETRQLPALLNNAFKERQGFPAIFQNQQVIRDVLVCESLAQKIDIARIIFNYYNLYGAAWLDP